MHLLTPSLSLLLPFASANIQTHLKPQTIHYQPITTPPSPPLPLAILTFSPHPPYTANLTSYAPPSSSTLSPKTLIRLSTSPSPDLHPSTTTLTTLSAFHLPPENAFFRIQLSPADGTIHSVSLHARHASTLSTRLDNDANTNDDGEGTKTPKDTSSSAKNAKNAHRNPPSPFPAVQIYTPPPSPQPLLNKPIVLNEDGRVQEPEPQKSLLQR